MATEEDCKAEEALEVARAAFVATHPGEDIAWVELTADEPGRYVVGLCFRTLEGARPPGRVHYAVSKPDLHAAELVDDVAYCCPPDPDEEAEEATEVARAAFVATHPGVKVAWVELTADEPERYVVAVFHAIPGIDSPPGRVHYAVSKPDLQAAELEDDAAYRWPLR